MEIKLIIGLANYGIRYKNTRHNIGSWYVYLLASKYNQRLKQEKNFYGYTGKLNINNKNIELFVPATYMNLSGIMIANVINYYNLTPEEILVAHDELNLQPGKIKLKTGGSHGGHNGLKSIIHNINSNNFYRLRIGIGHPGSKDKVTEFVLGIPTDDEKKNL